MSTSDPRARLDALQAQFSSALRTPLARDTGSLRARLSDYGEAVELLEGTRDDARERLAIYNRQYWFRLFTALSTDYRLTARLVGHWAFNGLASDFLLAHPPRTYDLGDVCEGFDVYLERALPAEGVSPGPGARPVVRAAIVEAARIDAAFRRVFRAPVEEALTLQPEQAHALPRARLTFCAAFSLLEEHWPLVALRHALLRDGGEGATLLPEPHPAVRAWVVTRTDTGHAVTPVSPHEARLLTLLRTERVGDALAALEREVPASEHTALAGAVQRCLAQGMRAGYWSGVDLNTLGGDHA